MLRVLSRPKWLGLLALALVFALVTFELGSWQWHRRQFKEERKARVEAHYDGPAVPLAEALPPSSSGFDPDDTWTRVTARGSYAAEDQLLVRNRPHDGVYGYEVLVPFEIDGGGTLVVDRGWVPNAATAADLPDVPPAPQGEVEVTGWLRPTEMDLGRDLPEGQIASIDLPRVEALTGEDVLPAYLELQGEDPSGPRPAAAERPDTSLGSHLAYAIQWWMTMPIGLVLVLLQARRTAEEEREARGERPAPVRQPRPPRAKKTRIWDEEDA